jgi:hypothetical protein
MCFVLNGLDEDYDGLIEAVTGCEDPMTPQDLLNRLLATEKCVEARRSVGNYSEASANAAHRGGPHVSQGRPQGSGAPGGKQPAPLPQQPQRPPTTPTHTPILH